MIFLSFQSSEKPDGYDLYAEFKSTEAGNTMQSKRS